MTTLLTGRMRQALLIEVMCSWILTSTEGANHPLCLLRTRLSKRGLRYRILRFLRALRNSRRVDIKSTTSFRGFTSAESSSSVSAEDGIAAVGDALGFNASQKAALQLMAMQPDKVPQKNNSVRVEIEIDPEIAEASEVLQGLSEDF